MGNGMAGAHCGQQRRRALWTERCLSFRSPFSEVLAPGADWITVLAFARTCTADDVWKGDRCPPGPRICTSSSIGSLDDSVYLAQKVGRE
uniref:Uncharacterized protein n=1 Tax=Setaria viridis TaxID=4556 RepID=A0A4U6T4V2_SETVI|nr:hypothetical protein SEVIR_9G449250v2 [Setaria viridis]